MRINWIQFLMAVFACGALAVSSGRAQGSSQMPAPIYRLDLTGLNQLNLKDPGSARRAWDTLEVAASIQGIVNRDGANLFIRHMPPTDDFWWNYLRHEQGWLQGRPVIELRDVADLLQQFAPQLKGVVLYKEKVPATANVADTIAGVESRMVLRYDPSPGSVYSQLAARPEFPTNVLKLFRDDGSPLFSGQGKIPGTELDSTGSTKNDAYLWAKVRYLDAGRCSREYMAYYLDGYWLAKPYLSEKLSNCTLANHDFFISHAAFFFDLGMWGDEVPVDDPGQKPGTDPVTLQSILESMNRSTGNRIIYVGGFVPWLWKYCSAIPGWAGSGGKHEPVQSEWQYARLLSRHHALMDADAIGFSGLANASFYQHFPLQDHYPQNPKPTVTDLRARGLIRADGSVKPADYVTFYMGDYDSAAWLTQFVPKLWHDPMHGKIPCNWAFNPNLDRRVPQVLDYVRTHQSANDWFISGDSGAGYLNPGMLTAAESNTGATDGWAAWTQFNVDYYHRYDLSITGFIIEGFGPWIGQRGLDAYAKFSPDGLMIQTETKSFGLVGLHHGTLPYIRHRMDLDGQPADAGAALAARVRAERKDFADGVQFLSVRTILKTPTWHAKVMAAAQAAPGGERVEFVDAYTFYLLLKTQLLTHHTDRWP